MFVDPDFVPRTFSHLNREPLYPLITLMPVSDFDPVTAFNHAEHFRAAVGMLSREEMGGSLTAPVIKNAPSAPYPELVMAFMGAEIYLKSILQSLGFSAGGHHNLWRHFSAIRPDEHKQAIRDYYSDVVQRNNDAQTIKVRGVSTDFDDVLKGAGDLFDSLRYIYEKNRSLPSGRVLSVGLAMEAIRRYALELLIVNGKLFFLMVEAHTDADGKRVPSEDGERLPINKDTPNLRQVLRERLFTKSLGGDPLSIENLDLVVIKPH